MHKLILTLIFSGMCVSGFAASFNSQDGGFAISLPTKWQSAETIDGEVLRLQNGENRITVTPLTKCKELSCLEKITNGRVKQVKNKKFKLVKNTYSGEEIKRTEFSTLDPLLHFSYTANGQNYTEGYFLADSKGYKIEIVGLPYLEAETYLPFISPKPREVEDLPVLTEEEQVLEENIDLPEIQEIQRQTLSQTLASKEEIKTEKKTQKIQLSKELSILGIIVFLYVFMLTGFFSYNIFFSQKYDKTPTNPKSFYPIRGARLYGSPDLFFRFYDSQGQNFIVTSQRWASFLIVGGFYGALFFFVLHFVLASVLKQGAQLHPMLANTALSLCYLFVAFGIIFMIGGKVLEIMFPPSIFIYSEKGTVIFKIIRKGSGLFNYAYLIMTGNGETVFRIETPKLFLRRKWMLFDKTGEIALIKEKSLLKALARKIFGHLGGSLRADYVIKGKNESRGEIISLRRAGTNYQIDIDKPQAFSPLAMLTGVAVISVVDRDKYYPWFN